MSARSLLAVCLVACAIQLSPVWAGPSGAETQPAGPSAIAVPVRLEKPAYVTLVIEDQAGNRVRNLLAETYLPAGQSTAYWDGYDDGQRNDRGDLVRHRVKAGEYRVRGLTHDGIRMVYQMTVDNPGSPPWQTKDGAGAWLADHSPPADILALPAGTRAPNGKGPAAFLVCSTSGEAGSEFVWLDAEGRRLFGTNDGFWGGTHLARDTGATPSPDHYAYVFESGQRDPDNFTIEVRGFRTADGQLESIVKYPRPHSLPTFAGMDDAYGSDGLAVRNGRMVFAVTGLNRLVFVDVSRRKVIGEAELAAPRSPAFDSDGNLWVLSGKTLKRFKVAEGEPKLLDGQTMVGAGLDDPRRLTIGLDANCYISDWGQSHQVRVFDRTGRPLRTIGQPGGAQIGHYDERRMAHPCGLAFDGAGTMWVAEGDLPKRISLWNAEGRFVRAFYGPEKYGGGGALDPVDPTRFFYEEAGCGIEFALDWHAGTSKVKNIYWRPSLTPNVEPMPGPAPERAVHVGGRCYLVNCFNGGLRFNNDRGAGVWLLGENGVARPVAMVGNAADLVNHIWGWPMKHRDEITRLWAGQKPEDVLFVWSDRNGDGIAQPDEIRWVAEPAPDSPARGIGGPGLEPIFQDDLSFTTAYGTHVPAPTFDDHGVPIYDLAQRKKIGRTDELRSPLIAGDRIVTHEDAGNSWLGSDLVGGHRWTYVSTPEEQIGGPGSMVQPTRLLAPAVTPEVGDAGALVAINGEMGAVFLMTTDGLFIQTLGGDARLLPPIAEPAPQPGQVLGGFTFQQEHFHPTLTETRDGKVYLVAGFQQGTILRLDGFESVRRLPSTDLQVTAGQVESLPATSVQPGRKQGRPTGRIAVRSEPIHIDGNLSDWPADTQWLPIDQRASAALAVDAKNLYAAFRLNDTRPIENVGRDYRYLFKTGGGLDVMIGSKGERAAPEVRPGDLRLFVTRAGGRTRAVVYRQIDPKAAPGAQVTYESPIGKVVFDDVRDVSEQLKFAEKDGNIEFAIPLETIGLSSAPDGEIPGDVGILRGAEGHTMQRVYWSNTNTTIVSDLPSEARLQPEQWGIFQIR